MKPQRKLREICERAGISFLDLYEGFRAKPETGLFTDKLHLTDAGHRLVGGMLAQFLEGQGLVPLR